MKWDGELSTGGLNLCWLWIFLLDRREPASSFNPTCVCVCVSMLFLLCSAQADTPYVRWLSATTQQLLWLPARFCVHGYSILICNEALMGEQESHKNHPPTHKSILGSIYKLSCIHASICTPALGGTHSPTRSIHQYILCCISSDWACKQTQHAAQNY